MREVRTLRTWQGATPSNIRQRMMYEVAAKHVGAFSRAWLKAIKFTSEGADLQALTRAVERLDASAAVAAIPALTFRESEAFQKMQREFERAYLKVIDGSAEVEMKRQGFVFKSFSIENPYSIRWVEARAGALIKGYIQASQIEIIRQILSRALTAENARPPRAIATEILEKVDLGLTPRDERAVNKIFVGLLNDGFSEEEAAKRADKIAEKKRKARAVAIARTETIDAEARGVLDTWRTAEDQGLFPLGMEKEWIAAEFVSERPPCQICQGLDGQTAPLNENFTFFIGSNLVSKPGPTAHPNCRCTIELRYPTDNPEGPFSAQDFGA